MVINEYIVTEIDHIVVSWAVVKPQDRNSKYINNISNAGSTKFTTDKYIFYIFFNNQPDKDQTFKINTFGDDLKKILVTNVGLSISEFLDHPKHFIYERNPEYRNTLIDQILDEKINTNYD